MKNRDIIPLCLCALIGAGFATGRELVTYFVSFGIYGFMGIGLSAVLFALAIYLILKNPCKSLKELTRSRLPGPVAFIAENLVFLFLIVLYSAMLAAAGETFYQLIGIHRNIGRVISALLCFAIIWQGASAVADLSKVLFLPMAVIIFIISATLVNGIAVPPENILNTRTIASPIIYLSYNMITTIALLIVLPKAENPVGTAVISGFWIFLLSVVLALPLYINYSQICSQPLPVMALIRNKGMLSYLYTLFLLSAIFTTAVSSGYSAVCTLKNSNRLLYSLLITALALCLSFAGFSHIVDRVYFVFGIAGILLLGCLV